MRTRWVSVSTAMTVILTGLIDSVLAGMPNVDVRHPTVFPNASVNLVVLPYDCVDAGVQLGETGRQLAMLVQLDTFFSMLKYGSVGAIHTVAKSAAGECDPDVVIAKLLGKRAGAVKEVSPGHGLIVFWGRVYQEGTDVYVRNYVRFLRREVEEELDINVKGQSFTARMSVQEIAFPPNHITARDLSSIQEEFNRSVVVRENPNLASVQLPLGDLSGEHSAYWVADTSGEWIQIQSYGPGPNGWVRAALGPGAWPLHKKMPELDFVDMLVGYLRYRVGNETRDHSPAGTLEWIEQAFNRFEAGVAGRRASIPLAVGKQLIGILRMGSGRPSSDDLMVAQSAFEAGAKLMPYSAEARSLNMIGRICTTYWGRDEQVARLGLKLGKGIPRATADDMLGMIALDPRNTDVLNNLENFYQLLEGTRPRPSDPARDSLSPKELLERKTKLQAVRAMTREIKN